MVGAGCLIRPTIGTARVAGTISMVAFGTTTLSGMFIPMDVDTTGMEVSGSIFLQPTGIRRAAATFTMEFAGMYMEQAFTLMELAAATFITKAGGICTRGDTTQDIVEMRSTSLSI